MPLQKRLRSTDDPDEEEQSAWPKKSTRSSQLNTPQERTQATKTVLAMTISNDGSYDSLDPGNDPVGGSEKSLSGAALVQEVLKMEQPRQSGAYDSRIDGEIFVSLSSFERATSLPPQLIPVCLRYPF